MTRTPAVSTLGESLKSIGHTSVGPPGAEIVLIYSAMSGHRQNKHILSATSRPGPVLIDLPIDVQVAEVGFGRDTFQ